MAKLKMSKTANTWLFGGLCAICSMLFVFTNTNNNIDAANTLNAPSTVTIDNDASVKVKQNTRANGPEIRGLTTVPVNSEVRLSVTGLKVPEGSLEDVSKWASKLVVSVDEPETNEDVLSNIELDVGIVRRKPNLYFSASKPGIYVIGLCDRNSDENIIIFKRVYVGGVTPEPPTPGPGPGPTPPNPPVPQPGLNPFPAGTGFRVMILEESSERGKLTQKQQSILTSTKIRQYLETKCTSDQYGPGFRFVDHNVDFDTTETTPTWKLAIQSALSENTAKSNSAPFPIKLPLLVISSNKGFYYGVLPEDVDSMLTLLKKYGE